MSLHKSIYCLFYFHMIEHKPITAFSDGTDNLTVLRKTSTSGHLKCPYEC